MIPRRPSHGVFRTGAAILLLSTPGFAQVVSYESTSLPVDAGWTVTSKHCDPQEWLEDGWLIHHVGGTCKEGPNRGQLGYGRSIAAFAGERRFFVEWRLETDGPREELVGTAPALLTASGLFGVFYHLTIARDQFRLVRGQEFPVLRFDLDPGVPHRFRVELTSPEDGEPFHVIYVDGEVVVEGVSVGPYPGEDSVIHWRSKSWFVESTTRWDYIRYGVIPEDGSGDFDSDDDVDQDDYYFFHECLAASGPDTDAGPGCRFADFDADTDVDLDDFAAFQERFTDSR